MSRIELSGLAHSYSSNPQTQADYALYSLDHVWEDGTAYAILGPSGCGKTTLLNIISGLLRPSEGRVILDGRDVTTLSPKDRNIAQVFQFPVVYDTMTVFDNLAFPLRNRGLRDGDIRNRVHEIAEMLELNSVLGETANRLTADAKQTISLGRGLVRSDVAAVLLDEPLTVIDPQFKLQLRRKLRRIQEQLKLTVVYVTHDQGEALTFADKVVVMRDGEVLQLGTPQELFESPAHTFVGHFIGSPGMNFLPCVLDGNFAVAQEIRIPLSDVVADKARVAGGALEIGTRPEFLKLIPDNRGYAAEVVIHTIEDLGNYRIVTVRLREQLLKVKLTEQQVLPMNRPYIEFSPEFTKLYADGVLIA